MFKEICKIVSTIVLRTFEDFSGAPEIWKMKPPQALMVFINFCFVTFSETALEGPGPFWWCFWEASVSIDSRACSYCSQEPRHFHDSRDSALRTRSSNARLGVHSNHQGSKSIFVTSDRLACERILSCSAGGHLGLSTYFAFFASITRGPSSQWLVG